MAVVAGAALEKRARAQAGDALLDRLLAGYLDANPDASRADLLNDLATDRTFRIPAIRLAERQVEQHTPVWLYRFDRPSPVMGGKLGACYALELPFVFNTLDQPGLSALTGTSPARATLAERMHDSWIAFASGGDPSTAALPAWPAFDPSRRATMLFNEACQVEDDPQGAERRLWDGEL